MRPGSRTVPCLTRRLAGSVVLLVLAIGFGPRVSAGPPQASATGSGSYLTAPLYLGEEPPPLRSLARIFLAWGEQERTPGRAPRPGQTSRSREDARRLADELIERLDAGASFTALAAAHTDDNRRNLRGVLGSFAPGMLRPELDAFLWSAEVGEHSGVLELPGGVEIVQRIPTYAGCRTLYLEGRGPEQQALASELLARARAGASFASLIEAHAREGSSREIVFERGETDQLLKREAFEVARGEVFGPFQAPGGLVLGQRVAPEELSADAWPESFVRARAIFIAHRDIGGSVEITTRSFEEARQLAESLHAELVAGADMEALARRYDDDRGGKARAGDLGWLYRSNAGTADVLQTLFRSAPGELSELLPVEAGWLLLRRER